MVPLLLFFFVQGLYSLLQLMAGKYCKTTNVRPAAFCITLFILSFFCNFPSLQERHNWATGPYPTGWHNYFQIAKWVKNNTPKSTLVCCRKPSLFYMYAERMAASYKFLEDDKALIDDLRQRKFDYVVVADLNFSSEELYLVPAVQKNEEYFTRVAYFKNPPTYLLKINR